MKKTYLKPEIGESVIAMNAIMQQGSNQTLDDSGNEYEDSDVNAKGFVGFNWEE